MTEPENRPRRLLEVWLPLAVLGLDQATKAVVRTKIPLYGEVAIVPGFLNFTHVRNTGAAYGFLEFTDFPMKALLLTAVAAALLIAVVFYAATLTADQRLARIGVALVIGGALGNLVDRLVLGSVVDFVDVYWRTYHFWAFNVADSAITVGVVVLLLDTLTAGTHVSKTA